MTNQPRSSKFTTGQKLIEQVNPAESNRVPVTFVRWFNEARTYARVRYENGRCLSVPANTLTA